MVSIVIVSHSYALAEALAALARQVAPAEVSIAIAAGCGVDHQEFGTNALEILAAIQSVFQDEGVLVLMDLGSAVISAEMARDWLPENQREKVHLCRAPLVEGVLAAAVQASLNIPLEIVENEAINALKPKQEQLQGVTPLSPDKSAQSTTKMTEGEPIHLKLSNPHGLHARPAAQFVQTVLNYDAQVTVSKSSQPNKPAPGNSLNALTALGAIQGDELLITAKGKQADQVLHALQELIESNFFREETKTLLRPSEVELTQFTGAFEKNLLPGGEIIKGIPISEGIALGEAIFLKHQFPTHVEAAALDPESEWKHLQNAIQQIQKELEKRYQSTAEKIGEDQATIFKAHQLMLADPLLLQELHQRIFEKQATAVNAWETIMEEKVQAYLQVEDPYLRQRSADLGDIGNQVLQELFGIEPTLIKPEQSGIVVADELNPNDIAQLDPQRIVGAVTRAGGTTSHAAILLRGLGIPSVSGIDLALSGIQEGDFIALDGTSGVVWKQPSRESREKLIAHRETWLQQRREFAQSRNLPAITQDGVQVNVYANVGSLAEAEMAYQNGAEGVGVLRTEFLFLKRLTPPTEEEQIQILEQIANALPGCPIIVRTLDIGGDKSVPYISLPHESNPFLGVRAIRLAFQNPDIFLPQLRAILRAAANHPIRVLFPMVATLEDLVESRSWIEKAHQDLDRQKISHQYPIEIGIMVEIPSAALISPKLAERVDFFSIGTNDLTQYTLAAERGNRALINYSDALHPAILFEIDKVVHAAHENGKKAAVCGEVASDPKAVPILVGLDVDELSIVPNEIPRIKSIIRSTNYIEAKQLAEKALNCTTAQEVRQLK